MRPRLLAVKHLSRSRRSGKILVLAALLMVPMLGFVALAVDLGTIALRRTQAQLAADAAVLAAVDRLGAPVDEIEQLVDAVLSENGFDQLAQAGISRTIEFGAWSYEGRSFTPDAPGDANALRVELASSQTPAFFGRIFGRQFFVVNASATAARSVQPRDIVLVLDCSTSMDESMGNGRNRMENVSLAAEALLEELMPEDRIGLAVYSWTDSGRDAYERTGVTEHTLDFDKGPVAQTVSQLTPGYHTSGTNIGGGLRAGLDTFLNSPARPVQPYEGELEKTLVLMTDGYVNLAEPYPWPDNGPTGVLPPPPYAGDDFDERVAVARWADTIKARGIVLHVVTLGSDADDPLMANSASTPADGRVYYHHVAESTDDYEELTAVYRSIGRGKRRPQLVD